MCFEVNANYNKVYNSGRSFIEMMLEKNNFGKKEVIRDNVNNYHMGDVISIRTSPNKVSLKTNYDMLIFYEYQIKELWTMHKDSKLEDFQMELPFI